MRLAATSVLLAAAPALSAQLSETLGPLAPPLGCPVHYTLSNDGPTSLRHDPCGVRVYDAAGGLVFDSALGCGGVVQLAPGGVSLVTWNQQDLTGLQVPAGTYFFDAPGGVPIQVGGAEATIAQLGAAKLGPPHSFELCSPQDPNRPYLLLASGSNLVGLPTCGGTVPLDVDVLFGASLVDTTTFQSFFGVLDASGRTQAPTLNLPNAPQWAGLPVELAFAVLDPAAPCIVRRISEPLSLVLF